MVCCQQVGPPSRKKKDSAVCNGKFYTVRIVNGHEENYIEETENKKNHCFTNYNQVTWMNHNSQIDELKGRLSTLCSYTDILHHRY
jgi:hypothetical protein